MNFIERLAGAPDILRRIGDNEKRLAAYGEQVTLLSDGLAYLRKLVDQIDDRLYQLSLRTGIVEDLLDGVRQPVTDKLDGVRQPLTDKLDGVRQPLTDKTVPCNTYGKAQAFVSEIAQGNTLQHLRKSAGLTQAELASRLGVDMRTVRRWEVSKDVPKRTRLAYGQLFAANNTVTNNEPMQAEYLPALHDEPAAAPLQRSRRSKYLSPQEFYARVGFDKAAEFIGVNDYDKWGPFIMIGRTRDSVRFPWRFVFQPATLRLRHTSGQSKSKHFRTKSEAERFVYKVLLLHEAECIKRGCSINWWLRVKNLEAVSVQLETRKASIRGVLNEQ